MDFDAARITVRRAVSHTPEHGLRVKDTKTGKQRTIPLDSDTLEELRGIQAAQRKEQLRMGAGWRGAKSPAKESIAAEPDGSVMPPDVFGASFRTFCEQEKVTTITPHLLRHEWASQMIALGFDAVTIAAMSGHSPEVLLTVYAHAFDTRKRQAMDALREARKAARAAK